MKILICVLIWSMPMSGQTQDVSNMDGRISRGNTLLLDVLLSLKEQKNVRFLYEPQELQDISVNTAFDVNKDIDDILRSILPPLHISYKRIGNRNFVLRTEKQGEPKEIAPYISGVLVNATTGLPLFGGTVRLEDGSVGTLTDEQGYYYLNLPNGKQNIVFSYIGYFTQKVEVEGPKVIHIHMEEVSEMLDEVVITAVGLEAKKQQLAYSVEHIEVDDLVYSNESNLISALSSKVAGVFVLSASGSPGASSSMFIRGYKSINGQNKPLFILDGIPVDNRTLGNSTTGVDVSNRLIDLNPLDYESISILKGPAATALYGLRAANGAVVIKSKRGEEGKLKINYHARLGVSEVNKLPPKQTQYAQGKFQDGQAMYRGPESSVNTSYGPLISDLEFDGDITYPYDQNGRLVPKGQGNGTPANIYDPFETFFVNGQTSDHHVSASGGFDKMKYYVSLGHFHETGIVPNANFNRLSLKAITEIKIHPKLTLENSTYLVRSGGNRMKRGALFSGVPLGLFRNPISFDIGNGKIGKEAARDESVYILPNGEQRAYRGNARYDNPFWTVNRNPYEDKVNRLLQQLALNYTILPGLQLSYRIGLDIYRDRRLDGFDIYSGTHRKGEFRNTDIMTTNISSNLLLHGEKKLPNDWKIRATLGHNVYSTSLEQNTIIGRELEKPGIFHISNALDVSGREDWIRQRLWGVFAETQLNFRELFYLNLSLRNDWSSTLASSKNRLFYPSASMAFSFSELLPMKDQWLKGKVRFSYSKTGNDAQAYLTDNYFDFARIDGDDLLPATIFPAYGVHALERSSIRGNPNLRAESTHAFEIGTELYFLKYRLWLETNVYYTKTLDQVVMLPLSAPSGFLFAPQNAGSIDNRGIEVSLGLNLVQNHRVKWDIQANYTRFISQVSYLSPEAGDITLASFTAVSSMAMVGQPFGVLVGTAYLRDDLGRMIIGQDGFPLVDPEQKVIGNPNPKAFMGIRNTLTIKNFRLNTWIDIRQGGDRWNGTKGVMSFLGTSEESGNLRDVSDFVFEGVKEDGTVNTQAVDLANPANGMDGIWWRRYGFLGLAEKHIESAGWVRLRELSLAYMWNLKGLTQGRLNRLELALSARNLLVFTSYSGIDPDSNLRGDSPITGWDYFNLPNTRSYSFNLNFTL